VEKYSPKHDELGATQNQARRAGRSGFMKDRVKAVYLSLGHILNNPGAFGFEDRVPKELSDVLSEMQRELLDELKEEIAEDELLAAELSQDTDRPSFPAVTSTSFSLRKE